jgi:hypothetical protein
MVVLTIGLAISIDPTIAVPVSKGASFALPVGEGCGTLSARHPDDADEFGQSPEAEPSDT